MRNKSTNLSRSLISVKIEKTPTAPKVVPKCMVILYGYVMVRKDRNGIRAGGGVAVICRKDWKIKAINANGQFEFETLWCKITTPNSEFFAASVYHPPDLIYEPADLLNFLSETCDQILHDDLNAKIVIAGDINQLQIKDLMQQHGLHQMVKVPT